MIWQSDCDQSDFLGTVGSLPSLIDLYALDHGRSERGRHSRGGVLSKLFVDSRFSMAGFREGLQVQIIFVEPMKLVKLRTFGGQKSFEISTMFRDMLESMAAHWPGTPHSRRVEK